MPFGFGGSSQTPWEKADVATDQLLDAAKALYEIVKPDPAQMGLFGAGKIGGRAEYLRQAINKAATTLEGAAAADGKDGQKKLTDEHVLSVVTRTEDNVALLLDGLKRISVVHYHRFVELGMGIPSVVKIALGWIDGSTKVWLKTLADVNGNPEYATRIQVITDKLLPAVKDALDVYSGVKA